MYNSETSTLVTSGGTSTPLRLEMTYNPQRWELGPHPAVHDLCTCGGKTRCRESVRVTHVPQHSLCL
ncbi:hypothetical protein BD309DRAFT_971396 [Dichomitus squalens]|uniref:Uncharacterized protein n=1 Tax=Dichomitus squalens TaxID=114155 RepID=A0A4Q9NHJ9_9APHY|nr:hypothetical protein BD309DRAFT_971396 [Dichomitus squalens]TBU57712.1 hypothetical protein BD310DRAFT_928548 [Dichomitus squalens]